MKRVQDRTIRNAKMNRFERKKHLKSIGKTFFLMFLLAVVAGGFWFGNWVLDVLAQTRDLDVNLIVSINTTQILDRHGNVVRETGTTREWVHLYDISPVMIDALLSIEDARFFAHEGVDWTRTLGAQVSNVQTFIDGVGGLQGGSTLTQQLINQTHLMESGERETTIERKIQEMLLSFQIERILSKDQIIEAYLNYSPFGGGIYGIQAAAEFYFGVRASELTLSQAATLAGLVQAPNDWRPDWNTHLTEQRRDEVLQMMYRHGYINDTLRQLAASEPISDMLVYYTSVNAEENAIYNDYVNHVLNEAYDRWGINAHDGYIIETYLDPEIQALLVNSMTTNELVSWSNEHIQGAASIIEKQTGIIRGLAGRDLQRTDSEQNRERGFVMPTDIQRQIGSVAKPIWAYGPAMEHLKWGPGTMLNDDVFAFQSGMLVRNWSTRHEGRVTLRQALVPSWNPPALQAFNAVMNVDPDLVGNFVTGLGLPEERVELFESYAIGGNTTGFAPIHLAGAYAAFGNTGVYNEPRAIARIIAPDGTIYYQPPHEESFQSEQVMSEQTAYLMTDVLRSVMIGGPDITHVLGAQANVPGLYVAGKTGTTNFPVEVRQQHNIPEGGVPDVWMVGYTHEFTLAIWTGYESLTEGRFLHGATRDIANILFRQVMSRIPHEEPMRAPQRPEGIVSMAFELMSGTEIGQTCSPSAATPSAFSRSELFQAGHGPSCVSTRFSMPDAPENFRVSASGTTFEFRWDHIDDLPMTLSEAQSAVDRARGMILGSTYMTDAIRNMNPTEGQAAMMVRQIQASGETEYVVIATLSGGGTREFGPTTDNQLNVSGLSISEINNIESFHVITRFERSKQSSDPSNVVQNNIIDPSEFEVTIPNMEGFTLNQFHQWRNEHGIEAYDTSEAHSDTVPEGRIITTNPTGRMNINQRIRITVSLGPREVAEPNPNPEPTPDPNPEPTPDSSGTDDADPDDGFDPDDPLSQFIHLGFANHPVAVLPGRKDF